MTAKTGLIIAGVLLILVGAVWSLQGANLLGGSFMTGERQWLVTGLVCIVVGAVLLVAANRRRGAS